MPKLSFYNVLCQMIANVVFGLFIFLSILQYALGSALFRERFIVIGFSPLLLLFLAKIPAEIQKYIYFLAVLMAAGTVLTTVPQGYQTLFYLIYSWIHLSLVILLFKYRISEYIPLFIFYIFSAYVLYNYSFLTDISDIFPESSRNTISWISLVLCTLYYLLSIINRKGTKGPLPLFILVVTCVLAEGRSGIVISVLLLVCYFLFSYSAGGSLLLQVTRNLFLLCVFIGLVFHYSSIFYEKLAYFYEKKFENAERMTLVDQYINSLDFVNVFTGINVTTIAVFKRFHLNPHNSFIMGHVRYGLMIFFLIGFFIYSLFKGLLKRELYFPAGILGCILLRMITDKLAFVENFDFLVYFATLVILFRSKQMRFKTQQVNPHLFTRA